LDDAIFLSTRGTKQATPHRLMSRLKSPPQKAEQIARIADEVIAASRYTANWAERLCPRVTIIPTVVDGNVFKPLSPQERAARVCDKPVIGWIGTHSTAPQLEPVLPALERLGRSHAFKVRIVGAGHKVAIPGVEVEDLAWSREREVQDFRT